MNRNATALILIVLAVGIYFTFTGAKIEELRAIQTVNQEYQVAIDNSNKLIKQRDEVLKIYNNITPEDRIRLNKILPDNVDNVRLIIDVKDDIAARHNLVLKGIRTSSPDLSENGGETMRGETADVPAELISEYGVVKLSFSVTTSYQTFLNFLKDLEASLRIMDISRLSVSANDTSGLYDFTIEINTYWLKQ